jgi:hypothetical protein
MIRVAFIVKIKPGYTAEQVQKYYDDVHTKLPGVMAPAPETRHSAKVYEGHIVPAPTVPVDTSKNEPYWRMTTYEFKDLETMEKAFASEKGQNLMKDEPFNQMCEVLRIVTEDY